MIREDIVIKEEYALLGEQICNTVLPLARLKDKTVVAVCGESGSGKTVTAKSLQMQLGKKNISSCILHLDSYFILPPADNHKRRLTGLQWVGVQEVNMNLLQEHVQLFKEGVAQLSIPVVDYANNSIEYEMLDISNIDVLIMEGVYTFLIEGTNFGIFMERNYLQTQEIRKLRKREVYDEYVEQILEIEHRIIAPLIDKADMVIDVNYTIR
jgi:uridine kinase